MKRRTNLFYRGNNVDETNFLTFSNYPEHMTGVALAMNFKIFPSRFLCLYIPNLTKETKENFIVNYLVAYYENKLAFLRDECLSENKAELTGGQNNYPDRKMKYLAYLLKTIKMFSSEAEIVYESRVTEQNFNGTFSDIICTIDSSETFTKSGYSIDNKTTNISSSKDILENYLYNWGVYDEDYKLTKSLAPDVYKDVLAKFDGKSEDGYDVYYFNSNIELNQKTNSNTNEIKFNVIIPLYDIVNTDEDTNSVKLNETDNLLKDYVNSDQDINDHALNIPYGIWFANETVVLKKDPNTKYAPSWSLLIGTQFKPFPYSNKLEQDDYSGDIISGFVTFAEVLSKQQDIYDKYEDVWNTITEFKHSVDSKTQELDSILLDIKNLKSDVQFIKTQIENISKYIGLDSSNPDSSGGGQFGISHKWTDGRN